VATDGAGATSLLWRTISWFETTLDQNMNTESHVPLSKLPAEFWAKLRMPTYKRAAKPVKNANDIQEASYSSLEKIAIKITDKVGSMGFFLIILTWTVSWTGYNILATEVPGLGLKSFDPFPAFVAYLLISNVIQILLMPLIMVGQNLQGRHSETRAELDFEINQKAEKEVMVILEHLEHQSDLILQLMKHLDCKIAPEEIRAIQEVKEIGEKYASQPVVPPEPGTSA
jgi:uncharacterized membrane protein